MSAQVVVGLLAILAGPLSAVLITRWLDAKRLKQTRRMDVFRTLMRTRRMRLNPDHVGALNLVEIEFYGEKAVIDAWKAYWSHLAKKVPPNEEKAEQERFTRERDARYSRLLHAIAKVLGFEIEQLEIFEGGYVPQGWEDDLVYQWQLRTLLLDVLSGRRGIPVTQLSADTVNSPYPPPPSLMKN